ncbi:Hsp20/alpha crystallin family protein [Halomicrococcus sp. SG-WS-1]|uniref:Hsp20/alpha crystallin family protein n=1 Tax=Halomicrococcus sp. SG-WS-1 TaxID=3439057 RepID=UPI003F7AC710
MARRGNPFDEIEEMFDRMSRQFESVGQQFEESTGSLGWQGGTQMSLDVADRGEEFVVTVDLPGFEKEDIDVRLHDDRLSIDAEREEKIEEGNGEYLRRERSQQSVSRSVSLPEPVDGENVTAEYNNGVLSVTLPKIDGTEESREIDIG